MKHYRVTVGGLESAFVALSDQYAFDAVSDILMRKAFRDFDDEEAFAIVGPDGPVALGYGTLGDIRAQ